jgi:hypothetical protein
MAVPVPGQRSELLGAVVIGALVISLGLVAHAIVVPTAHPAPSGALQSPGKSSNNGSGPTGGKGGGGGSPNDSWWGFPCWSLPNYTGPNCIPILGGNGTPFGGGGFWQGANSTGNGTGGAGNQTGSGTGGTGTGTGGSGNQSGSGKGGNGTGNGSQPGGGGGSSGGGGSTGKGSGSGKGSGPNTPANPSVVPPLNVAWQTLLIFVIVLLLAAAGLGLLLRARRTARLERSAGAPSPRPSASGSAPSNPGGKTGRLGSGFITDPAAPAAESPRDRIVREYGRFLSLFPRDRGEALRPLTPSEIQTLAARQWSRPESVHTEIRRIFEEARYSEHPITPDHLRRFESALQKLALPPLGRPGVP